MHTFLPFLFNLKSLFAKSLFANRYRDISNGLLNWNSYQITLIEYGKSTYIPYLRKSVIILKYFQMN